MITTSCLPFFQEALAQSLAFLILCCCLSFSAGVAAGTLLHQWMEPAQASKAQDSQQAAIQEAWEAEVASGHWSEPKPAERHFIGSDWDVEWLDEEGEADPFQQELPLCWAA